MPAPPIVIGQEFLFTSVRNPGEPPTTLTVWVTVTGGTPANPGSFSVRWDNGSPRPAKMLLKRVGFPDREQIVPSGTGGPTNVPGEVWTNWRTATIVPAARIRT